MTKLARSQAPPDIRYFVDRVKRDVLYGGIDRIGWCQDCLVSIAARRLGVNVTDDLGRVSDHNGIRRH
ncbi:hypothetical protein D3C81_2257560 [compost metagenome]